MQGSDEVLNTAMWAYVGQHYDTLWKMCLKASRGDENVAEELFSDEVLRMMPGLIERWDGIRSFHIYACKYFSLHLRKTAAKRINNRLQSVEYLREAVGFDAPADERENSLEVTDTIRHLLECLNDMEKLLVMMTKMQGYSYREAGAKIGKSYGYVAKVVNEALNKLRKEAAANDLA